MDDLGGSIVAPTRSEGKGESRYPQLGTLPKPRARGLFLLRNGLEHLIDGFDELCIMTTKVFFGAGVDLDVGL